MHPVLFQLGQFNILSYTLFSLLAIIIGSLVLTYRFRKNHIKLDIFNFLFWIILAGAVGAKLLYIILYPSQFSWSIFYSGGAVSWGGIIFGSIAAIYILKKNHQPIFKALDAGFFALLLGLAIGRIGSFLNGDGFGKITNSKIGIIIPSVGNLPRFPAELFESLAIIIVLIITLVLEKKKVLTKYQGLCFGFLLISYSLIRFVNDFFKDGFNHFYGLTLNQYFSIILIAIIIYVNIRYIRDRK